MLQSGNAREVVYVGGLQYFGNFLRELMGLAEKYGVSYVHNENESCPNFHVRITSYAHHQNFEKFLSEIKRLAHVRLECAICRAGKQPATI